MHARLSTYEGQAGELAKGFDAQTNALEQLDGFIKHWQDEGPR